jgi:hypothetical protein
MWKLETSERLAHWRTFRKTLDSRSLESALADVSAFWQNSPFSPYYLDPADSSAWPDPWLLISENYYCDVAKALGMLYTITLTVHAPSGEIRTYYDQVHRLNYNLVWIDDGKYVLNMIDGEVLNKQHIPNTFVLKHRHDIVDLMK